MKNIEIIALACAENKITEDVETYAGWKRAGYKVKKGSTALFKTKIWKPKKGASAEEAEIGEEGEKKTRMYLVNAAFFGISQVEKIEKEK